jgi:hypothetical protein
VTGNVGYTFTVAAVTTPNLVEYVSKIGAIQYHLNLRGPSSPTESPEQLWIVTFGHLLELAIRSDDLNLDNIVHLHTKLMSKRVVASSLHPASGHTYSLEI